MRVIGIDPGLGVTGFGILDRNNNRIEVKHFGTIRPPAGRPLAERLHYLFDNIMKLIAEYQPQVLAVEDTFHGKNIRTALLLGQARGVLLLAGARSGITCCEYAPRKVKQSVTGNGAATKEQVQYMVKAMLKLDKLPTPIDASDALAVGLCHLHQEKG
ncbi:MAG: crossover junction endodeoxyribonuclease RuvC [Candidatus Neomarinimicrobiota bacterium]